MNQGQRKIMGGVAAFLADYHPHYFDKQLIHTSQLMETRTSR